ncbi:MAG: flippase [Ignavibacteria bacterium]|nr:flippase [Ignavibacteria bacterium]
MKSKFTLYQLIARNTALLFIAQLITKIIGFAGLIVLANYLNVEQYGVYNFALAFASLFVPLCDLGVDTFLTRELSARVGDRGTLIGTTLALKAALSFVAFGLIAGVNHLLAHPHEQQLYVLIAGGITIIRAYTSSFTILFRADQRMGFDANTTITAKLFEVGSIAAAIILKLSLLHFFALLLISSLLQLLYTYVLARKNSFLPRLSVLKHDVLHLVRGGLPFALTGISVMIYFQIDTVMLSFLAGERSVGIYRAATNLVFALSGFSASVVIALFPVVAQNYQQNSENAVRISSHAIYYSLLFSLPIAFGATVMAQPLISVLYKESFASAVLTLQILVWWLPIMYVTNVLGHILGAIKLQKLVLAVSSINALVNIGMNLILIPLYTDRGAAVTTVLTELLGLCVLSYIVVRRFGSVFDIKRITRLAIANLIILPIVFFNTALNVGILILIGAVLYTGALFGLRAISMQDITELKRIFFSRTPRPAGAS